MLSTSTITCEQLKLLGPCFKTGGREHWIWCWFYLHKAGVYNPISKPCTNQWPKPKIATDSTITFKSNITVRKPSIWIDGNEHSSVLFHSSLTVSRTFHSLFRVLFNFPSRYLFAIGLALYLAFGETYLHFELHFQIALLIRLNPWCQKTVTLLRAYHPLWSCFPTDFKCYSNWLSVNPNRTPNLAVLHRWAFSCSLAATKEIPVGFFSSPYWYA